MVDYLHERFVLDGFNIVVKDLLSYGENKAIQVFMNPFINAHHFPRNPSGHGAAHHTA